MSVADLTSESEVRRNDELIDVLWRRRWLIAIFGVVCAGILAVVAFAMTPIYRGAAVLVPADINRGGGLGIGGGSLGSGGGAVGGLAALAGLNLGTSQSQVEESLAVLKSRQFTETFISRNNLMPELFAKQWDKQAGKWRVEGDKQPTLNRGFKAFDEIRTVTRDTKTGLITLQVDWHDRQKAVDWTDKLVQQLNDEMRARAITDANASLGYLQKELASANEVSTREAISRLIEAQIKQRMLADVTQEYSLRYVDRPIVPDAWDKVAPRKALMIAAGLLLGLVVGMSLAILINTYEIAKRRRG
jgi:uncharacterized protein involved in exopolysaccharide biosynthesis